MKGMCAIVKKELRSYFYSPMAYVIIGAFLFCMGIFFAKFVDIYNAYSGARMMGQARELSLNQLGQYLYQNMVFLLCISAPFFTMKLYAEEKRQSTLELLLTSPISSFELVLGKFFAAYLLMAVMVGLTFIYALFMIVWGNPDIGVIATTYFGLLLTFACYIALGGLISSLTSSQVVAAFFSFIALLIVWLLQALGEGVTTKLGPIEWGPVLVFISPLGHFNRFAEGAIHLKDLIYYFTFVGFCLFCTHRVIESNRWR